MKQIFTVILSSLFALYIVEAYLTGHGYYKKSRDLQEKINTFKNKTGKNYDTRPFFQAYNELRKNANDLVPMIPMRESLEVDIEPYALSNGVSNSPTLFCNESGKYIKYLSLSDGGWIERKGKENSLLEGSTDESTDAQSTTSFLTQTQINNIHNVRMYVL